MMKKPLLSLLLSFALITAFAQESPTIKVNGSATLSVAPSQTTITFGLSETRMTYQESIEVLTKKTDKLTKALQKAGMNANEIKTINFNINKNIIYNRGQRKDSGYVASQTLFVVFKQDKDRLLKVLNAGTKSDANPSVGISFGLSADDKVQLQETLITMAVKDANKKATLMAETAGYKLNGVKEIQYGLGNNHQPRPELMSMSMRSSADSEIQNFEAADLTFSEKVYLEVYIKQK